MDNAPKEPPALWGQLEKMVEDIIATGSEAPDTLTVNMNGYVQLVKMESERALEGLAVTAIDWLRIGPTNVRVVLDYRAPNVFTLYKHHNPSIGLDLINGDE